MSTTRRWTLAIYGRNLQGEIEAKAFLCRFEEEFMAQLVLPGGKTIAEAHLPDYRAAIEGGKKLPSLLGMQQ